MNMKYNPWFSKYYKYLNEIEAFFEEFYEDIQSVEFQQSPSEGLWHIEKTLDYILKIVEEK